MDCPCRLRHGLNDSCESFMLGKCVGCVSEIVLNSSQVCAAVTFDEPEESASPEPVAPCISTQWIRENGLEHAVIRNGKRAEVLCIPGLPCGTKGHLLRRCNTDGGCTLMTYSEVCSSGSECVPSFMRVSQLSHSHDWTSYRSKTQDSMELILTSLSMHPSSNRYSLSRTIAYVTDAMNKNGFGWLSNMFALFRHNVRNAMKGIYARAHSIDCN